jgi:hypothetical protein
VFLRTCNSIRRFTPHVVLQNSAEILDASATQAIQAELLPLAEWIEMEYKSRGWQTSPGKGKKWWFRGISQSTLSFCSTNKVSENAAPNRGANGAGLIRSSFCLTP